VLFSVLFLDHFQLVYFCPWYTLYFLAFCVPGKFWLDNKHHTFFFIACWKCYCAYSETHLSCLGRIYPFEPCFSAFSVGTEQLLALGQLSSERAFGGL
jgi:hypothetical protein